MIKVRVTITKEGSGDVVYDQQRESLTLVGIERMACEAALKQEGSIIEAAKLLGITRHALKRRIIKHNIRWVPPPVAAVVGEPQAS